MKKKKILFFSHDSQLNGASRSLIDIADYYKKNDIDVRLIIPNIGIMEDVLKEKQLQYKVRYYPLLIYYDHFGSMFNQFRTILSAFRSFPSLLKYVRNINPDLIYINSVVNYWLLVLAYFYKKTYLLHIREFGAEDHKVLFFFNSFLLKILKKRATVFITNSNAVGESYKQKYGIESIVIYNGVLPKKSFAENLKTRATYNKNLAIKKEVVIGMVGNITPNKGQLEVLKAFHRLSESYSNLRLVLIGGGRTDMINVYVEKYNLSGKVEITGFKVDVNIFYQKMDILIMNSTQEAFGRVAVEASSYGIPVVGRNTGATPEIILNGKTGLLHNGKVSDIIIMLDSLITDESLREKYGMAGWKRCKELFSFETSIAKIDCVFNRYL